MQAVLKTLSHWKTVLSSFFLLVVYLCGGANLLPGLLTAAAIMEGSHMVQASNSESEFQLVLHHETKTVDGIVQPLHKHGFASKVFCLLASQNILDPDHTLQLSTAAFSEKPSLNKLVSPGESAFVSPIPAFSPGPGLANAIPSPAWSAFSVEWHSPPGASAHLPALRVTVLVI